MVIEEAMRNQKLMQKTRELLAHNIGEMMLREVETQALNLILKEELEKLGGVYGDKVQTDENNEP